MVRLPLQKGEHVVSYFPSCCGKAGRKDEVCALRHSPSCQHRMLVLDSLPKPCSPALAGVQIPSSLHSLGLGKESGFLRFLTTLLPEHKDKELFISALLLNMAFLSQSWSPPLLAQVSGAGGTVHHHRYQQAYPLSASPSPCPAQLLFFLCLIHLSLFFWNFKLFSPHIWLGWKLLSPCVHNGRIPSLSSPQQMPSSTAIVSSMSL